MNDTPPPVRNEPSPADAPAPPRRAGWSAILPPAGPRRRSALMLLLMVGSAVALYAPGLSHDFVMDDLGLAAGNALIRDPARAGDVLGLGDGPPAYRPVRTLSYMLDFALGGGAPWAFHLINAVLHGLAAFLALRLLRAAGAGRAASVVGALVLLVHPVNTEAVQYIAGRRDLLVALWVLGGLLAYLRVRAGASRWWWGVFWVCGVLGAGSKESIVILPPAVLLLELALQARAEGLAGLRRPAFGAWRRLLAGLVRRRYGLLLASAGFLAAAAWYAVAFMGASRRAEGLFALVPHGGSFAAQYLTVARLWVHSVVLLCWPQQLLADYSPAAFRVSDSAADAAGWLAVLGIAVGAVLVLRGFPGRRLAGFWIAFFALALLPASHLVPHHELFSEHNLYLPSLALAGLVAGLFDRATQDRRGALARRARTRAAVLSAAVLLGLGARTVVRLGDWRDEETIWRATVRTAPRCARAHSYLGLLHQRRGEHESAIAEYRRALAALPTELKALNNLSELLLNAVGRTEEETARFRDEAARLLQRAVASDPSYGKAWLNLAVLHARRGDEGQDRAARLRAQECFEKAVACYQAAGDPALLARLNLALVRTTLGRFDDAVPEFQRLLDREDTPPRQRMTALRALAQMYHHLGGWRWRDGYRALDAYDQFLAWALRASGDVPPGLDVDQMRRARDQLRAELQRETGDAFAAEIARRSRELAGRTPAQVVDAFLHAVLDDDAVALLATVDLEQMYRADRESGHVDDPAPLRHPQWSSPFALWRHRFLFRVLSKWRSLVRQPHERRFATDVTSARDAVVTLTIISDHEVYGTVAVKCLLAESADVWRIRWIEATPAPRAP